MTSTAGFVVIGLHLFSQLLYTVCMWVEMSSWRPRALWLLLIWGVPVIGIGIAGARFSRALVGKAK
ncbi:MAG: hypothetical protein ACXVB9_02380 [Bdellovibrionota bacterium]